MQALAFGGSLLRMMSNLLDGAKDHRRREKLRKFSFEFDAILKERRGCKTEKVPSLSGTMDFLKISVSVLA